MREIELKFAVHPSFELSSIRGRAGIVEIESLTALTLRSAYYDTVDLRLARNGVTLRHRTGDEGPVWTLKLPTADTRAAIRNELDFEMSSDEPPAAAAEPVTGFTRTAPLERVAVLETKRDRWKLLGTGGAELAVVYHDEVAVIENGHVVTRFREIELETVSVGVNKLLAIGEALHDAGAVHSEPVPKAIRALGPRATAPSDVPPVPALAPAAPGGDAVKALIVRSVDRLISHHAAARLGDDEGVHQMRVAVRRLRSDLRTFGSMIDQAWSREVIPELKWLADLLGETRDLDVLAKRFEKTGSDLKPDIAPLLEAVGGLRADSRAALYEGLRGSRYGEMLEKLVRSAQNPPLTAEAARPCSEILIPYVAATWKKLRKAARPAARNSPAEQLHKIRIRAKRVRYAAEAVAPALGAEGGKAASFARAAAKLQEVLGEHQDATVAQARIRELVGNDPSKTLALAAGRLIERQQESAAEARSAWRKAWKQLDRKKSRSWLRA
jgi:inorganic triphosphatase YgiF